MKVLLINGSPKANGCTATALDEVAKALNANGVETEMIQIGNKDVRGCIACGHCNDGKGCVFNDVVNEVAEKLKTADGMVVGSPVYYSGPNGTVHAFMDRLFYSNTTDLRFKVGASVVSARRAGTTSSLDVLNKYFTISQMPVVSSHYWPMIHGNTAEEAIQDKEGLHIMKTLGENMAFMIKCIQLGKEKFGMPERERYEHTNFIR